MSENEFLVLIAVVSGLLFGLVTIGISEYDIWKTTSTHEKFEDFEDYEIVKNEGEEE